MYKKFDITLIFEYQDSEHEDEDEDKERHHKRVHHLTKRKKKGGRNTDTNESDSDDELQDGYINSHGADHEIDEEINKAEEEILDFKKKSPEKIKKIAIETSADLIKQIIGAEVNNSNNSAIVEDISKKSEGKYYGN